MRAHDPRRLARIVEIRSLKARAAEIAVAAAASDLRRAEDACNLAARSAENALQGWRRSVAESIDLELTRHWAGQVGRSQDRLTGCEQERRQSQEEKGRREEAWAAALAGSKAAEALHDAARRRARRRLEDRLLGAAEDRATQRGSAR